MKSILIILFLFCFKQSLNAQDSLKSNEDIGFSSSGRYIIKEKNFSFLSIRDNVSNQFLTTPISSFSNKNTKKILIGFYDNGVPAPIPKIAENALEFDSCRLDKLSLDKLSGSIMILKSHVKLIEADSLTDCTIRLLANPYFDFSVIKNSKNIDMDIQSTDYKDSAQIWIENSTINRFDFGASNKSGLSISFDNDTINGYFGSYHVFDDSFFVNQNIKHKFKNIFTFRKCHINADFVFFQEIPNSIFSFIDCSFGSNSYMGYFWASRVEFINCIKIPEQISAQFDSRNPEMLVSFVNTNLENLRMNFTSKMRLVFDSATSKDFIYSSYEKLLSKFSSEGKPDSYKYVDIQYQKLKSTKIGNFFKKYWWYYGYRKDYVWIWTFCLLLLFCLLNAIWWRHMLATYPVLTDYEKRRYNKNRVSSVFREGFTILLFTIYVFFSLRISLEKLKFKKIRFVALFFLQFAVGLWCLFFILRAVLKI